MTLLRSFPILTIALVVLGMVGFSAAYGSVQLLFVGVTLAALSWYVTEGPRGRTLPRWVSNVLVLAVTLAVVIDLLSPPNEVLQILGRFGVWLALIKLYERRTARDHGHLMGLSLLLMLIGCLRATSFLFGIVLLLYAVIGVYVLLLYQLFRAREQVAIGQRTRPDAAIGVAPSVQPTLGRHHTRHFRLLAAGVGGAGLLLSVFVFLIFPRGLGQAAFGATNAGRRMSVTGYADVVDLVTGGRITTSPREVATLTLTDDSGAPVPLAGPPLLRGAVLDSYQGGRWTASRTERRTLVGRPSYWTTISEDPTPATGPIQSYIFHEPTATLFALAEPGFVRTATPVDLTFDAALDTLEIARDDRAISRYDVRARPVRGITGAAQENYGNPHGYLSAPSRSVDRVRDLAHRLLTAAALPTAPPPTDPARGEWNLAAARVFASHLQSGSFRYTLDLSDVVSRGGDPVAEFLFEHRRGHCEFFASALAALCHTVEIDARLVAGYRLAERTPTVRVRALDAHAWVEVRSGPAVYTPVDPTPPAALATRPDVDASMLDRFEWLYRQLEGTWSRTVITFDDRQQAHMLAALEGRWSNTLRRGWRSTIEWAAAINRAFYFGAAGYVWLGLVAFAIGIAMVAVVRGARRMIRLRRALHVDRVPRHESRRFMRQLGFYLDMLRVLRVSGRPKPAWQPPLDFARALEGDGAAGADEVRAITDLFYRVRFGGRSLDRDELKRANELVATLASARGARRP